MIIKTKPLQCVWTYDPDGYSWGTACKNAFYIDDGTPEENSMKFCCFCGGELNQEAITDDNQD